MVDNTVHRSIWSKPMLKIDNLVDDYGRTYHTDLYNILNRLDTYFIEKDPDETRNIYFIRDYGNTIYIYFNDFVKFENIDITKFCLPSPAQPYRGGLNDDHDTKWKSERRWRVKSHYANIWQKIRFEILHAVVNIIGARDAGVTTKTFPKPRPNINNIICVGYSNGSVLSALCVEELNYFFGSDYNYSIYGYGFACPRFLYGKVHTDVKARLKNFYIFILIHDKVPNNPSRLSGYHYGDITPYLFKPNKSAIMGDCIVQRPIAEYKRATIDYEVPGLQVRRRLTHHGQSSAY